MKKEFIGILVAVLGLAPSASGYSVVSNPNMAIPDNDTSGIADSISVSGLTGTIADINVSLTISGIEPDGAYNGDFFVFLTHESGTAILLNRIGSTSANPLGYSDNGLSITFDDAAAEDVHTHGDGGALGGILTGVFQPDGRSSDPDLVLDTDPRTSFLGTFNGMDANGTWTLTVADYSQGLTGRLERWSLEIDGVSSVPESGASVALLTAGMVVTLGLRRIGRF